MSLCTFPAWCPYCHACELGSLTAGSKQPKACMHACRVQSSCGHKRSRAEGHSKATYISPCRKRRCTHCRCHSKRPPCCTTKREHTTCKCAADPTTRGHYPDRPKLIQQHPPVPAALHCPPGACHSRPCIQQRRQHTCQSRP